MIKKLHYLPLFIALFAIMGGIGWMMMVSLPIPKNFDCWGRLHTRISVNDCLRSSSADIFLSMHPSGQGYLLVTGTWSCQHSSQNVVEGMVNFNFEKQGDYYSIHPKERNPALEKVMGALRYNSLKMKITRLNSADYLLTLPNETLMICTED